MTAKTYLVTGAAGFIGARFVESCNARGISVVSVDEKRFFPSGRERRPEHADIDFAQIVDRDELFDWLGGGSRDLSAVVHMGACSRTTETDVAYLRRVNVEYSQKLWKFCTDRKIPFVYASSAATYGAGEFGYDDDEAALEKLKPLNEYGRSKAIFDVWAVEQEKAGRAPPSWTGFKFFNVYGFGERHKGSQASVVLHAYDQIHASGRVKLFKSHRAGIADGEQKRDFIYVDDAVAVVRWLLQTPAVCGLFNVGTGKARSFRDLITAMFAALGRAPSIEYIEMPAAIRDSYQYFTAAETDNLRRAGYNADFTTLEDAVRRYVTQYLDRPDRYR